MRFFIGSSKEQLDIAKQVARWLEDWEHEPVLWSDHTVFPLGNFALESLIDISNKVDAAIFIFGADDKIWFRGESIMSVRDNVLLEYGLFIGKLSRKRVIFLCKGNPKIASDLTGITYADMSKPYNVESQLKQWVNDISLELKSLSSPCTKLKGGFQVTDLYSAFQIAFQEHKILDDFRVFAISTFKSVQMLRLMSDLRINHAHVLLRKYVENDWFYEKSMQHKIYNAVSNWKTMVEKKNILNLHLSFFNYHPDEGFYIVDDRYLIWGYLNYDVIKRQSEFADEVVLVDGQTEAGKKLIQSYIERFNKIYANYTSEEKCIS